MQKASKSKMGLAAIAAGALMSCSPASSASNRPEPPEVAVGEGFRPCADCPPFVRIPEMRGPGRKIIFVAKYELTWRNYIASVESGACPMAFVPKSGENIFGSPRNPAEDARNIDKYKIDWPVAWLDLKELDCYLTWLQSKTSFRVSIPTGEEWEQIARAGREGVKYPWGNEPDESREALSGDSSTTPFNEEIRRLRERGVEPFGAKVGTYSPNPWGIHDLMGNVVELVSPGPVPGDKNFGFAFAAKTKYMDPDVERVMLKGVNWGDTSWKADGITRTRYALVWKGRFTYDLALRIVLREEK